MKYDRHKKKSALQHILLGLIPYTRENMQLSFKPGMFFSELEKISGYQQDTLVNAMWRAQQRGYVKRVNKIPKLTTAGKRVVTPFKPKKLGKDAWLMVIFDIPEDQAAKRRRFRYTLESWEFLQVQKSVWMSQLDYFDLLVETVVELDIQDCVKVFESIKIPINTQDSQKNT